jgi:hypothetical protein
LLDSRDEDRSPFQGE